LVLSRSFLFHLRKQDVLDLAELEFGITVQGDELVLLVQLDARRRALEVIAVADVAPGDVDRVLQRHDIRFGSDVE
jgi:hypothetical protein